MLQPSQAVGNEAALFTPPSAPVSGPSAPVIPQMDSSNLLNNIHRGPWLDLQRNFVSYVLHVHRLSDGWAANEIAQLSEQWADWDVLTSLANYRFVVQILFGYLTKSSNLSHVSAIDVSKYTAQDMSQVLHLIDSILSDRETYEQFLTCRGTVAQRLLDLLQDLLDSSRELRSRASLSKALVRLSGQSGILPGTCFTLEVKKVGQQVAGGGFGDIWKGLVGGQTVAVKSMRQFKDEDVKASMKKLGREALIWRQLSHPNLLPFLGLYMLDDRLCLISPWMDNGDLKNFLTNAPSGIDRVSLIVDIARGLEYLHSQDVVHGDLKTVNILVTPSRRACITDFGLSSIVTELSMRMTFSSRNGRAGTVRYQAPELLKAESSSHYGSDVYAFACVSYEILTGEIPFFEIATEVAIIFKVVEGVRPSRLETISPDLWLLLEDCWHQEIDKRPTTTVILRQLLRQPFEGEIKQSPPDWDSTYSARFRRSIQEWPLFPSIAEVEQRMPSNVDLSNVHVAPNDEDEDDHITCDSISQLIERYLEHSSWSEAGIRSRSSSIGASTSDHENDPQNDKERTSAAIVAEEGHGIIVHGEGVAVTELLVLPDTTHLLLGSSGSPNTLASFLTTITPQICTSLLALDISANFLNALPPALALCACLEELNISSNPLRVLPAFLADLPQLRVLIADATDINTLPDNLVDLYKLHTISIRRNKIYALPSWLCLLPALRTLLIDGNPFLGPWKGLIEPLLSEVPSSTSASLLRSPFSGASNSDTDCKIFENLSPNEERTITLDRVRLLGDQLRPEEGQVQGTYQRGLRFVIAYLRDMNDLGLYGAGRDDVLQSRSARPMTAELDWEMSMASNGSSLDWTPPSIDTTLGIGGGSSTQTATADSSRSGNERKFKDDQGKRALLVSEIVATERTYVKGLQELVDIYIKPGAALVNRLNASSNASVVPASERKIVFGGIDALFSFHKESFLPDLENAAAPIMKSSFNLAEADADGQLSLSVANAIGRVFLKHSAFMKMYSSYINNFDNATQRIKNWSADEPSSSLQLAGLGSAMAPGVTLDAGTTSIVPPLSTSQRKQLRTYLIQCRLSPRHSQLNLEGYLLLPVQRIPRYRLLLEELLRTTPPTHEYTNDLLERSLAEMSLLDNNINEGRREAESRRKLVQWQSRIRGEFPGPLVQSHRRFIMDGQLLLRRVVRKASASFEVINAQGHPCTVQVNCLAPELTPRPLVGILCNDLLVLCRDPSQGQDPTCDVDLWAVLRMQTVPRPASIVDENALRLVDNEAILYFDAPSPSDALNWYRAINLHIPRSQRTFSGSRTRYI
ncbi:DH domain-containing protein [Mycena sanguinolenta]|uniref:DH domain-containing protein n=1 Tax=Mycena sanguinolenta TaxID=230812 RepID=A0A8H7D0R1_9AGAR|nr:DH domain-containing protein [Mycena sanguinolenta]